jgi:hypothetical protein
LILALCLQDTSVRCIVTIVQLPPSEDNPLLFSINLYPYLISILDFTKNVKSRIDIRYGYKFIENKSGLSSDGGNWTIVTIHLTEVS